MRASKHRCETVAAVALVMMFGIGAAMAEDPETPSQAGEKVGIEGQFVRVAENDEGWVVLGYRTANESVKEDWMLIDIGLTVQNGVKDQTITRDDVTLVTPDHKVVPLPTQKEYENAAGTLRSLNARASMQQDSINYFPPGVNKPCRIGFFADTTQPGRTLSFDQVDLNSQRGCVGRVYFQIPGGIQYGLYNLDVKFADSTVRVPVKIMNKEDAKAFEKQWKEEKKENKK